jgi:hypothetical protein
MKNGKGNITHLIKGVFHWKDGSSYEGDYVDNFIQGYGVYRWEDGREYTGEWQKNRMHGKGYFVWSDGKRYNGTLHCMINS